MLADTTAFSSFAVDDLTAATRFYAETLGLRTTNHAPEMPAAHPAPQRRPGHNG